MTQPLSSFTRSTNHTAFHQALSQKSRVLMIQDLDGVCMGLVRDPHQRALSRRYVDAVKRLPHRFFVLTNGEHVGSRGVNGIVAGALPGGADQAKEEGLYLPSLAAGGVQWQDCYGQVSHPGVSANEMEFLAAVPKQLHQRLAEILAAPPFNLSTSVIAATLPVIILDNAVSPTLNIGSLHDTFSQQPALYSAAQQAAATLMQDLLQQASDQHLGNSFFVHLAPNLGSQHGQERLKPAQDGDMGTTDFQFMLRGAIKEAGVLVLLNQYYHEQTGQYPLGEQFSARSAPATMDEMLALAKASLDPEIMPAIVGIGDTVTSAQNSNTGDYRRGGSDRGFLTLVQRLGEAFASDNATVFVDSSAGELNRPGVQAHPSGQAIGIAAMRGITDAEDPLQLNLVFTGGHQQYIAFFDLLAG